MHLGGNRRWVPLNFVVKSCLVPDPYTKCFCSIIQISSGSPNHDNFFGDIWGGTALKLEKV